MSSSCPSADCPADGSYAVLSALQQSTTLRAVIENLGACSTGESNAPRPPSPERPPTPSSRPARRRHLIPAFIEADISPPKAPTWAGSNRMFAPMPQQLPRDSAHTHAPLPARPASASVAGCPRLGGPEMSWTGSMQLPAGLLKLAARPQQAPIGRKDKHQYDWGFGQARGLV